jgi:hypothetical protein
VSGKKNSFTATLYLTGEEKKALYTVDGQWANSFNIYKGNSKSAVIETYDANANPTTALTVPPLEEQDPLESRRAWSKVAAAIAKGDMESTSTEKGKIEDEQRAMRRAEQEEGREWKRRYFKHVESDALFDKLGPLCGQTTEADKTDGIWRFDEGASENGAVK